MFMKMMLNKCSWLRINAPACNENCQGKYCHSHNRTNRYNSPPPACAICNVNGTKSISGVCKSCNGDNANLQLYNKFSVIKRRAKKMYGRVLAELLKVVPRMDKISY